MIKILELLYHGNIQPAESYPPDPEYKAKCMNAMAIEDALLVNLPDEKREMYDKLQNACGERDGIDNAQIFVNAFKLGARMMLEVMLEDE